MSLNDEVRKVLPLTEDEAVTAGDIFSKCTWAEDLKSVSTSLSNLFAAKLISRKETDNGRAKFAYWNAIPVAVGTPADAPKTLAEEVDQFVAAIEAKKAKPENIEVNAEEQPTTKPDAAAEPKAFTIQLKSKKVFEIAGHEESIGELYQIGEAWNSMIELRTKDGVGLILSPNKTTMFGMLSDVFGMGNMDYQIIKASDIIIDKLTNSKAQ